MQERPHGPIVAAKGQGVEKRYRIVGSRCRVGGFLAVFTFEPKGEYYHIGLFVDSFPVEQFDGIGFEEVVAIEILYVFSPGSLHTVFAGIGYSLVGSVDDYDAGVLSGKPGDNLGRVVGTAVVDNNDFQVGKSLTDNRLQTGFELFAHVVNRNDDRDSGCHYLIFFLQI